MCSHLMRAQDTATDRAHSPRLHHVVVMWLLLLAILLSACSMPSAMTSRPEEPTPSPEIIVELPWAVQPGEETAAPVSPETDEPVIPSEPAIPAQERFLGVWTSPERDYLYIKDDGTAELYLAGQNQIISLDWSEPTAVELRLQGTDALFIAQPDETDALLLEGPGIWSAIRLNADDLAARDQIRHDTGCCFLGDWDMYTFTQIPLDTVATFRSDHTCSFYGGDFTWAPGVAGYEDRDGISIYLYGELYYVLLGSDTPLGDRAFLSKVDYRHLQSSGMFLRAGTNLEEVKEHG